MSLATVVPSRLKAAWRMEESSGNLVDIVFGRVLNPTALSYQVAGKVGSAIAGDGVVSFAESPASDPFLDPGNGEFTVACWVSPNEDTGHLVEKRVSNTGPRGWYFSVFGVRNLFFALGDGTLFVQGYAPNTDYANGSYHLAIARFRRTTDGLSIKIDGNEQVLTQAGGDFVGPPFDLTTLGPISTTDKFTILAGRNFPGDDVIANYAVNGLDEVLIFNTYLSDAECGELWNGGNGVNIAQFLPTAPLVISSTIGFGRKKRTPQDIETDTFAPLS